MHCELGAIKIKTKKTTYCVLSVYRPPSGYIPPFLKILEFVLNYCDYISDILFLCADLNIGFLSVKNYCKKFLDELINYFGLLEYVECSLINMEKLRLPRLTI